MSVKVFVPVLLSALAIGAAAVGCKDDDDGPKGGTGTSTATDCPATTSGGTVGPDGGPKEGGAVECTTGSESGTSGGSGGDPNSSSGTTNP